MQVHGEKKFPSMEDASNQSRQCEEEANDVFTDNDRDSTVQRESVPSLDDGMGPNPMVKADDSGAVERRLLDVKEAWQS